MVDPSLILFLQIHYLLYYTLKLTTWRNSQTTHQLIFLSSAHLVIIVLQWMQMIWVRQLRIVFLQ